MEKWATGLLGIKNAHSSVYPTQDVRIAQTLFGMQVQKDHEETEKRCELSQHREPSYLQATLCLSRILEYNGKKRMALQEIFKARTYLQSLEIRETHPGHWHDELDRFWRLCDDTNSVKETLVACTELSDRFPDRSEYVQRALEWIQRAETLKGSFGVLSTIREVDGRSLLTILLQSQAAHEPDFHQHLCSTLNDAPHLVLKAYTDANSDVQDEQQALQLRHWYGVSLFYQGKTDDSLLQLQSLATDLKRNPNISGPLDQLFAMNAEQLVSVYIELARNNEVPQTSINQYTRDLDSFKGWIDCHRPYQVNFLSLLLGRFYHLTNHHRK